MTFRQLKMSKHQQAGSILKLQPTACIATARSVRATPVERSRLGNAWCKRKLAKYKQIISSTCLIVVAKVIIESRALRILAR